MNTRETLFQLLRLICAFSVTILSAYTCFAGDDIRTRMVENESATATRRFVDVTQVDGKVVLEPLIPTPEADEEIAQLNTKRIKAILTSPEIGEYCRIHFPAGMYYFKGAAEGWTGSIQSTATNQSFTGDGINATLIRQMDREVESTFRIEHENCTIENLSICSSDRSESFVEEWDKDRHQIAIHFVAKEGWATDPQVLNVNINSTGNDFVVKGFFRPFETGMRFDGAWLNVYVQSMFIQDVLNAIYINQGELIAGPAKFIDINAYATSQYEGSKSWNTFFKSEGHFMEQVELIHCTYIGSQFIYMDGTKPNPGKNPVYNMIVDHCYINSLWLPAEADPKWSGIYMNLPPKPGGIDKGYGSSLYSKLIYLTNNTCGGKTPERGAFFYIEGNVKGVFIEGNNFSSGGGDKCIYLRPTLQIDDTGVAMRNIEIRNNYFNDFRNPICIGGDIHDPVRENFDYAFHYPEMGRDGYGFNRGRDDDPYWIENVVIAENQTFYLPIVGRRHLTGVYLNKCRQVSITGNNFMESDSTAYFLRQCEQMTITGNNMLGVGTSLDRNGIELIECSGVSIADNALRKYRSGLAIRDSKEVSISGNTVSDVSTGIRIDSGTGMTLTGNVIGAGEVGFAVNGLQDASLQSNRISHCDTKIDLNDLSTVLISGNVFSGTGDSRIGYRIEDSMIRSNIGMVDR